MVTKGTTAGTGNRDNQCTATQKNPEPQPPAGDEGSQPGRLGTNT